MRIDIWSDVVCPFCYLGKYRLQAALADWEYAEEVQIFWHSFELDRQAPAVSTETLPEHLSKKYGMSIPQAEQAQEQLAEQFTQMGLTFNWRDAHPGNTFDAHRVIHFAQAQSTTAAEAIKDRLMRGYFTEGVSIGDRDTLVRLAGETGLDEAAVRAMLDSDEFGYEVRADEAQAGQLGINGVPFFVFDQRLGLSGAQPVEVFTQALQQAYDTKDQAPEYAEGGCGGGCCGGACGTDEGAGSAADSEAAPAADGCAADACAPGDAPVPGETAAKA